MGEEVDEWENVLADALAEMRVDEEMEDEWANEEVDEEMDEWADEEVDEKMDEWADERGNENVDVC